MLIAAAIVGLVTAYYFGVRPGLFAAGGAVAAFLAAMVIPGAWLYAYGIVGVYMVGIFALGPKMGSPSKAAPVVKGVGRALAVIRLYWRRLGK